MIDPSEPDTTSLRMLDEASDLVFDVGPLAIARMGPEFPVERANRRFCELTGYTEEERPTSRTLATGSSMVSP